MGIGSWSFTCFAFISCIVFSFSRDFQFRKWTLLLFNFIFVALVLESVSKCATLAAFIAITYAVARLRATNMRKWPSALTIGLIALLWIFLFCIRDHDFWPAVNPFTSTAIYVVGVSYIAFRSISFILDGDVIERFDFISYTNYLIFFPSLFSGPIARFEEFNDSVYEPIDLDFDQALKAIHRLANGLIKKFVLADAMTILLPNAENIKDADFATVWFGTLLGLFVLFLDFSGYCDIAISIARLMGFALPENFDKPFLARNVQEFWNRWHITLSTIIRDYFFMPITKFFYSTFPEINKILLVTISYSFCMMLIAIWHGITINYIIYGALNAASLILLQVIRTAKDQKAVMSFKTANVETFSVKDRFFQAGNYLFFTIAVTLTTFIGKDSWDYLLKLIGK